MITPHYPFLPLLPEKEKNNEKQPHRKKNYTPRPTSDPPDSSNHREIQAYQGFQQRSQKKTEEENPLLSPFKTLNQTPLSLNDNPVKILERSNGPTLRANPFPKVTDLFCRIPLPTLFYRLEATHLEDLLRLSVRSILANS